MSDEARGRVLFSAWVTCAKCPAELQVKERVPHGAPVAVHVAEKAGWTYRQDGGGWYCPECRERFKTTGVPRAKPPLQHVLLRPRDAAARLAIGVSTLAKMRLRGDGPPYVKLGAKTVAYWDDELVAWAEAKRRRSTSEDS